MLFQIHFPKRAREQQSHPIVLWWFAWWDGRKIKCDDDMDLGSPHFELPPLISPKGKKVCLIRTGNNAVLRECTITCQALTLLINDGWRTEDFYASEASLPSHRETTWIIKVSINTRRRWKDRRVACLLMTSTFPVSVILIDISVKMAQRKKSAHTQFGMAWNNSKHSYNPHISAPRISLPDNPPSYTAVE